MNAVRTLWHAVREFFFNLFYESYLVQILLLVFLLLLPLIVFFVRRSALAVRLRRAAKKHGYTFRTHRAFWFLGNISSAECECSVANDSRAYAIKLVGVRKKSRHLCFLDETNLNIKKSVSLMYIRSLRVRGRLPSSVIWKPHPKWRFYTPLDTAHDPEPILLQHPKSGDVTYKKRDMHARGGYRYEPLKEGDTFFGMTYHTPKSFLALLEEHTPTTEINYRLNS